MIGEKVMQEKDMEDNEDSSWKEEFRSTSLWYGPHSPLSSSKENQDCTAYRHIFFPNKL